MIVNRPNGVFCIAIGLSLVIALSGCKIEQTTTTGGYIRSASGEFDCPEANHCEFDVPNGEPFVETFRAIPRFRYAFAGWASSESYLCSGNTAICRVELPTWATSLDGSAYMTAEFYHQPELINLGEIGVEYGIWSTEISLESGAAMLLSADFDGDGDDDVVLTTATYPNEEFTAARSGVILINEGEYSFRVAGGDRPNSVHPREILMADFNDDGLNDFFIADHGYDAPPFPGWSNQLLLATDEGYSDVSDRLPDDDTGFTHNAAVGDVDSDGDIDILVANNGGEFLGGGPYLLVNDGDANFTSNQSMLPRRVVEDRDFWPWAVDLYDLDGDGHPDLLVGGRDESGQSYIHWGPDFGEVTELPAPDYFFDLIRTVVISTAIHDLDGDGRPDILLGGYNDDLHRGMQVLINRGNRDFSDQTQRRIGSSAWSRYEGWHTEHRFFDFNGDGTTDIVPQRYDPGETGNVLAWLNDGTGHFVTLKTSVYSNSAALYRFATGIAVSEDGDFKSVELFLHDDGNVDGLFANAAVVQEDVRITLPD